MKTLKVGAYNIYSMRVYPRIDIYEQEFCGNVINEYSPDILGLTEVSSGEAYGEQPKELAKITNYPYFSFTPVLELPKRLYGNALLSKYPIIESEMIRIEDAKEKNDYEYFESRGILKTKVDVLGGITVIVSHFGLAQEEKKNAVKKVIEVLGDNPKKTI